MSQPEQHPVLWRPSENFFEGSHLHRYMDWLADHKHHFFNTYDELWQWSITETAEFWESVWQYFEVISHAPYRNVMSDQEMPGISWFEGAELNYAEHIFRMADDGRPALHYISERGHNEAISWSTLQEQTGKLRNVLRSKGIGKGDRVAAYLSNTPEAIVCFLAVNSLGAVWSCCSPDFGSSTVLERFSQIEPDIFIAHDGYTYNGKQIDRRSEIESIRDGLESVSHAILIPSIHKETDISEDGWISWSDVLAHPDAELQFQPVGFNHPMWVLYSSGTTGRPKAITHSHGGVLLEHLKYMHFHNDVHPGEHFFWYTTTGWMMWNFLQASLLAGATAVLYDGSPAHPDLSVLWQKAAELPIHHFGTSAPYHCFLPILGNLREALLPVFHLAAVFAAKGRNIAFHLC